MTKIFTNWRTTVFGLLSWAIPFAASIPFYGPHGLMIPLLLFKSIMIVIGALAGVVLLVWLFRHIRPSLGTGLAIGLCWLILNWLLDILVLLPLSGDPITSWFANIGLRYLVLPIVAIGMGAIADGERKTSAG